MPIIVATTILGDQPATALQLNQVATIALWFPGLQIPALRYRKVGTLRLIETLGNRQIIVWQWDVIYPGIYPVFNRVLPTPNFTFYFNCFRPGLAYSLFWA